MTTWDGNSVAGLLQQVFGGDVTTSLTRCAHCDAAWPLAEAQVYRGAGIVMRCPHCGDVVMVIMERGGVAAIDAMGVAELDWPPR